MHLLSSGREANFAPSKAYLVGVDSAQKRTLESALWVHLEDLVRSQMLRVFYEGRFLRALVAGEKQAILCMFGYDTYMCHSALTTSNVMTHKCVIRH